MSGKFDGEESIPEILNIMDARDGSGRPLYARILFAAADELGRSLQYEEAVVEELGEGAIENDEAIDTDELVGRLRENPVLLDELYTALVDRDKRKEDGQFFTPPSVAEFMVELLPEDSTVLDPAVGPGVFAEQIFEERDGGAVVLNDIDPLMLCATELRLALNDGDRSRVSLSKENYLEAEVEDRVDAIICNPPYNRFQNHDSEISRKLENETGVSLGGFSNIYPLFLLKAVSDIEDGRIVFITPFEFLDTGYGTELKRYLLDNTNVQMVISLQWEAEVFDALTTAAITIIDTAGTTDEVTFVNSGEDSDLGQILESFPEVDDGQTARTRDRAQLDPAGKWSRFFGDEIEKEYLEATIPLAHLAKVNRGIATGHNEFFTLSKSEIENWGVEEEYIKPVLSKARQAPNYTFTDEDFQELYHNDKKVNLLHITSTPSENASKYLEFGKEEHEAHERYLTSHRNPWYKPEQRDPCPILATVFSRENMRFVQNEKGALNLAAFHCVYPQFTDEDQIRALLGYLNSDPALQLAKLQKRQYADGLGKFEPGDLSEIPVLDIRRLSEDEVSDLAHRFTQLDAAARQNGESAETEARAELNSLVRELLDKHRDLRDKEKISGWTDSGT